jgi:hypothetical protein
MIVMVHYSSGNQLKCRPSVSGIITEVFGDIDLILVSMLVCKFSMRRSIDLYIIPEAGVTDCTIYSAAINIAT